MKRYIFLISFCLFFSVIGYAQVTIGSMKNPEKAALLDLKTDVSAAAAADNESADKGLLLPRVNLSNLNSLEPFIASASDKDKEEHTGLMVYNLNATSPLLVGIYIWNGSSWEYTQQQKMGLPVFDAANGTSKTSSTLRLGGTLKEETTIDQANNDFKLQSTTGTFSINTNALAVASSNTGIGTAPTVSSKLTVGGETNVSGNLSASASTSNLKKTNVTGPLYYKDAVVPNPKRYILQSTDATGKASWVNTNTIPGITASPYIEGSFTGSGLELTVAQWNATTNFPINTAKISLPKGLWLVYLSLVVEPTNPLTSAAEAIWGRFTLRENSSANPGTGTTGYNELGTATTANAYRIGALNISDRVYPNMTKNVIKGYMIIRVRNTPTNFYVWLNNRSTASGYAGWTNSGTVKIGDSSDPQNYMVAFPL